MRQIARGTPFLVPVVIDATAERDAIAPEAFLAVQWTRLPGGETSPAFVARVQKLLGSSVVGPVADRAPDQRPGLQAPPKTGLPPWIAIALGAAVLALIAYVVLRPAGNSAAPAAKSVAETKIVTAAVPAPVAMPAPNEKSVAVLPFENLSAEPESAYFADGLHEEVLTAVGKVSALRVVGRASVMQYADAKKRNLGQIAATLGVGSVVEGSVRRAGNRVRIAVQLVDAQTSRQLWGDAYERELTDVFAIQAAIAQEIAATLRTTLTAGERAAIGQQLTQNAEAYRIYLQGVEAVHGIGLPSRATRARLESAIAILEQAVAMDPTFVLPHLRLTELYGNMFWYGDLDPSPERARQAEAAAARVRQLASASPEARLASGIAIYQIRNDWAAALPEFRAAQIGLPNQAAPIRWEGNALRRLGRYAEAVTAYTRAFSLDPQLLIVAESIVETQISMRRYLDAIHTSDDFIRRSVTTSRLRAFRANAQFALDEDLAAYRRALAAIGAGLRGVSGARVQPWRIDTFAGDFASAEANFENAGATVSGPADVIDNPIARDRALLAYFQGDVARTHQEAATACRYFESGKWTSRQEAMAAAELTQLYALTGDASAARTALQRSRDLFRQRPDAFVEAEAHAIWGGALIVLGDREAALAELRTLMTGPGSLVLLPVCARLDPLWSRLKDDPRFEEILKLAKPL